MKCKYFDIDCGLYPPDCKYSSGYECLSKTSEIAHTQGQEIATLKDKLSRRNKLITDLRGQVLSFSIKKGYRIKPETARITYNENPKLYRFEDNLYNYIEEILNHRVKKYDEDFWKEALPATLFTILDHYDRDAVKVAVQAIVKYLK